MICGKILMNEFRFFNQTNLSSIDVPNELSTRNDILIKAM